jgi:Uma2 family endonuclease
MVIAAPEPKAELQPVGEQRVVLRGLPWEAYLQILEALPQSRGSRLTYDDGVLEITVPLEDHEFSGRLIERFILTFNDHELPSVQERRRTRQCLLLAKSTAGKGSEC